MNNLVERLRKPCGHVVGHGQRCCEGYLCDECNLKNEAANRIEQLERVAGAVSDGESFLDMRKESKTP